MDRLGFRFGLKGTGLSVTQRVPSFKTYLKDYRWLVFHCNFYLLVFGFVFEELLRGNIVQELESMDLGADRLALHFLPVWCCMSSLMCLCLSVLICKVGVVAVPTSSGFVSTTWAVLYKDRPTVPGICEAVWVCAVVPKMFDDFDAVHSKDVLGFGGCLTSDRHLTSFTVKKKMWLQFGEDTF